MQFLIGVVKPNLRSKGLLIKAISLVVGLASLSVLPALSYCQTGSVSVIGFVTTSQVSNGLGFNLNPAQDWEWAAAARAGATHARFQCSWTSVEQKTSSLSDKSVNPSYVEDSGCARGFVSSSRYGIHPTVVAAYGPPYHKILTLVIPGGADAGSKALSVQLAPGETKLSSIIFPYAYICQASPKASDQCGPQFSGKHSYEGTLITGIRIIDPTHATLTLASALTAALPADSTPYIVNEILYPSAASEKPTDASVIAYANYVSFLAKDMASRGVTGDIEMWNEPPWSNDPWDYRAGLYDPGTYPGSSEFGANFGFAANLMNRSFPAGVTATWAGTSGSMSGSLLGPRMQQYSGTNLKQPSRLITSESFHPYGGKYANPEDSMFVSSCVQGTTLATPRTKSASVFSNGMNCYLPGQADTSNFMGAVQLDMIAKLKNPAYGIGHSITETNELPPAAGLLTQQARAVMRQFIGFQADGITPVEFFKLYTGETPDPSFTFVHQVGTTGTYTPTPAYTALSGFMSDIKPISNEPAGTYSAATLPSVVSYQGTYPLAAAHMIGARVNATANSDAFTLWQISACTTTYQCWYSLPSPKAAPVTIDIPANMKVTSITDLITRGSIGYTASGQKVTFKVADNPIEILVDPKMSLSKK